MNRFAQISSVSRSFINLNPTVACGARGVPIARGINLNALAGGHDGEMGHGGHGADAAKRSDVTMPKWSVRMDIGPSGAVRVTTPINGEHLVNHTVAHRLLSIKAGTEKFSPFCPSLPVANPTGRSYGKRFFSTSTRSQEGEHVESEHVPRSPLAKGVGFHASEVPNFTKYTSKATESGSKGFSYFMIGTMGLITAAGAKSLVSDFLKNMSASADVLALAKVEVDMNTIPEGKNVIIKVSFA